MPTDPNILLGLRPPQPLMPAQIEQLQLQREAAADLRDQRRLAMQQRAMELRDAAVYQRIMQETQGDLSKAGPLVRQYAPRLMKQYNDDLTSYLDAQKKQTDMGLGLVGVLRQNPNLHGELAPIIAKYVPDLAGVIDRIDPNSPTYAKELGAIESAGMSAKERYDREWDASKEAQRILEKTREHEETVRAHDLTAATSAAGQAITMRGQDLNAATAREGQRITMRGQDMAAATAANRLAFDKTQGTTGGVKLSAGQQQEFETMLTVSDLAREVQTLGDKIGWKGVGGFGAGSAAQFATNFGRGTADEQSLRNKINNIKATIAKLRGGTAFTPNEQALLESYTPTINDPDARLKQKLEDLVSFVETKRRNMVKIASGDLSPNPAPGERKNPFR